MSKYDSVMKDLHVRSLPGPRSRATEQSASDVERIAGAKLPEPYRSFVMQWGGSAFDQYVAFPIGGNCPFGADDYLDVLFGFMPGHVNDLAENLDRYRDRLGPSLLPVGEDPGGNIVCVQVKGEGVGRVFFWQHDADPDDDPEYAGLYPVANDWDEFIRSLRVCDEEEVE